MPSLPVFLTVDGTVVVVGAGAAARSKHATLCRLGMPVRWFADSAPAVADLRDAVAVISAAGAEIDEQIAATAKHHHVPVNIVDRPDLSTFSFPAIVDRGEVVVAIATGGASPVLARRLRERIEAILPPRLDAFAGFLRHWRARLKGMRSRRANDRRFWESVIDGDVQRLVLEGRMDEADRTMREAVRDPLPPSGQVTLVGAGPGDPGLLTLKALRALQDADVIFYDALVAPEILGLARRDAEQVYVGKRDGKPGTAQDTINERMIEDARNGRRVVRLKSGDPFVFGRGGEELEALRNAGIPVLVVPGITAALGCAAESQLPLTLRNEATRLVIATARNAAGTPADWSGTNAAGTTLVVYMGAHAAASVRDGLIAAGWSAATPAAVLARGTRPDAAVFAGRLDDLPALAARVGEGPALLVIGEAVTHARPWRTADQLELAA